MSFIFKRRLSDCFQALERPVAFKGNKAAFIQDLQQVATNFAFVSEEKIEFNFFLKTIERHYCEFDSLFELILIQIYFNFLVNLYVIHCIKIK